MNLAKHTIIGKYGNEVLWIKDLGDAWEIWCADCGYRLGTTTAPDIQQREADGHRLAYDHARSAHL